MFALVFNEQVIQVEDTTFPVAPALQWIEIPSDLNVTPGWTYDGTFHAPPAPPPPPVPFQVPMWAVRTVLQNDGLFDQAQALINETSDVALKNVWEYGNFADRNSRAINVLAIELGLTDAQVDQMFIDANNLSV